MRGLPDSAVVGTYKRVKGIGKPRRAKSREIEALLISELFLAGIKLIKKGKK